MNAAIVVAMISGCVALGSALISVSNQSRLRKAESRARAEEHALSYLTPLLDAAADLASRFWNIHGGFLRDARERKDVDGTSYGIDSTCYLIGRYLAYRELTWRELLRIHPDDYRPSNSSPTDSMSSPTASRAIDASPNPRAACSVSINRRSARSCSNPSASAGSRDAVHGLFEVHRTPSRSAVRSLVHVVARRPLRAVVRAARDSRLCRLQSALIDLVDELDPFENRVRRVGWTRCWEGSPVAVGVPVG